MREGNRAVMKFKLLIILILLFILPNQVAFCEDSPIVRINNYSGVFGEQISVDITLSANSNACVGMFYIVYDNLKLELVSADAEDVIKNAMPLINKSYKPNTIKLGFMTTKPIKNGGILCNLVFKIIEKEGNAKIEIDKLSFMDFNENPISVLTENGSVEIKKEAVENVVASTSSTGNNNIATPSSTTSVLDNKPLAFTDLESFSWAEKEILELFKKGIIKGTTLTSFSPQNHIKRADYMILIVRMLMLKADFTDNFADVKMDKYYYNEIGIAKSLGLTTGVGDNKFEPEAQISRQDVFTIAYRIMKTKGLIKQTDTFSLNGILDISEISEYAKEPLEALVSNGLVKGNENKINPLGNATRAEVAVFIYRLDEIINKINESLKQ
jgi:hypothetical protein